MIVLETQFFGRVHHPPNALKQTDETNIIIRIPDGDHTSRG
jgi:hypothetical protein